MTKFFVAAACMTAFLIPANAGSVTLDAMTPTLGGGQALKRMVVNYDDLNPAEAAGAATLYDRLSSAAELLCTSNPGGHNSLIADAVAKCSAKALKAAVKSVDSAALQTVAEAK